MRIWRSSLYRSPLPTDLPLTAVLRECDMECSIEEAIATTPPMSGALVINDIIETDQEIEEPIAMGALLSDRMQECRLRELNMAMLYFWNADHLAGLHPGGVISGTIASPLSRGEIMQVFIQLAQHPNWKHHTVIAYDEHKVKVTLKPDGSVITDALMS